MRQLSQLRFVTAYDNFNRFSIKDIERLASQGVNIRFFVAQPAVFERLLAEPTEGVTFSEVGRTQSFVYFAAITTEATSVTIDGQEVRLPLLDSEDMRAEIKRLEAENVAKLKEMAEKENIV